MKLIFPLDKIFQDIRYNIKKQLSCVPIYFLDTESLYRVLFEKNPTIMMLHKQMKYEK